MQRVKEILDKIRLVEDSYKINLSDDKNAKQQKLKHIDKVLREVLKSKKILDEKDFQIIEELDSLRFEEVSILKQPYMTLKEMRDKADLLGFIIIPISFSNYKSKNEKIQKIANAIGLNTYVITSLENYDVWRDVICSKDVGKKYFPNEYISVLLAIELMLGTQKNLYHMLIDNRNKIETLAKSFNKSMEDIQQIFQQISKNQQRLKKDNDYLIKKLMYLYDAEKDRREKEVVDRIEGQIYAEKCVKYQAYQAALLASADCETGECAVDIPKVEKPKMPIMFSEYSELTRNQISSIRKQYENFEESISRIQKETKLENVETDLEKFKLFYKFKELTKMQQIVESEGAIIFHTNSFNPAEDETFVFLNETLNIES